ncbi:hypothetical protein [Natrinema salaciae]|uniref:Uncharacterized protein n=1 Tax=Natrinema salaciae TaxID=1186196 RepID=A0A1H9FQ95_9EURY|nr:hypothetical protein [Natrinema salaciae]SEQ40067.1 hypothetical protein SAMN04489841_1646 [Natrinema salaciae]
MSEETDVRPEDALEVAQRALERIDELAGCVVELEALLEDSAGAAIDHDDRDGVEQRREDLIGLTYDRVQRLRFRSENDAQLRQLDHPASPRSVPASQFTGSLVAYHAPGPEE